MLRRGEAGICVECQAYCSQMGQQPVTSVQGAEAKSSGENDSQTGTQAEQKWSKGSSDEGMVACGEDREIHRSDAGKQRGVQPRTISLDLRYTMPSLLSVYHKSKGTNSEAKGPARRRPL